MFRSILTVAVILVIGEASAQESTRFGELKQIEKQSAKTAAAKSKVEVETETVTITATDLDNAKDTLFEFRILHFAKKFKIIVAPPQISLLKGEEESEVPLSLGKSLLKGYRESLDILSDQYPDLAKRIKDNPYDVRGNLDLAEKKLGLDKLREGTTLIERCYRVAWIEGLSRYGLKDISVTFIIRK